MKIREKVTIHEDEILPFLHSHRDNKVHIVSIDEFNRYHVTYEADYTEAEFNMKVLHTLEVSNIQQIELTEEEKAAIDYAIGAIKTLVDMGVLK